MSVALDLGCTEFRSLRSTEDRLLARRIDAVYSVLSNSPLQRQGLLAAGIRYLTAANQLIVPGKGAREVSEMQGVPLVPVARDGEFPESDPIGRQVVASLIESILPAHTGDQPILTCYGTLPGDAQPGSATYNFVSRVLKLRGYRLVAVRSALALIISQLATSGYTGLGFAFGSESVSVCLAHAGIPVWAETFGVGSRVVEEEFATMTDRILWDREGNRYLNVENAARFIRSGSVSLHKPDSDEARLLVTLYRDMLRTFLPAVTRALSTPRLTRYLPSGIPILVGGGAARIPGFSHLLYDALLESVLPVVNAEIKLAKPDPLAMVRGALIMSLLESQSTDFIPAAA